MKIYNTDDTICAISTGENQSAVATIRVSGRNAIKITNKIFNKDITNAESHTLHFGCLVSKDEIVDEVLISIFKDHKSFTGEECTEISCHGSLYIKKKIIQILVNQGCRNAIPGEFTMRAFKNGKIDLSQAESVADLISSETKAEHQTALQQLRGGFSNKLKELRNNLIDFASLIELELDFPEEDVEFANRKQLQRLLNIISKELKMLISSFKLGNAIKNGISVTILGAPNVGKSTLLNCLLNEEKAIVSDIAGTTRDAIEDEINIEGFKFRFIDTAGLRETKDKIEKLGIKKSIEKAQIANIVIFIIDPKNDIEIQLKRLSKVKKHITGELLVVINKIDLNLETQNIYQKAIFVSAKKSLGLNKLKEKLLELVKKEEFSSNTTIITNLRHYEELKLTFDEIKIISDGLKSGLSGELMSINIRQALFHLGSITGEVTTDTLLGNIFGKFCIGK